MNDSTKFRGSITHPPCMAVKMATMPIVLIFVNKKKKKEKRKHFPPTLSIALTCGSTIPVCVWSWGLLDPPLKRKKKKTVSKQILDAWEAYRPNNESSPIIIERLWVKTLHHSYSLSDFKLAVISMGFCVYAGTFFYRRVRLCRISSMQKVWWRVH